MGVNAVLMQTVGVADATPTVLFALTVNVLFDDTGVPLQANV